MNFLLIVSLVVISVSSVTSETLENYIKSKSRSRLLKAEKEVKEDNSNGATYQSIIKRRYAGVPSSETTAEILNTVTSPHSSASVSFTSTSYDQHEAAPPHPPLQHYDVPQSTPLPYELQNYIVNEESPHLEKYYVYGVRRNTTGQVSPKAFSYQPFYTPLNGNIKSFYKQNSYTPFVVPPQYAQPSHTAYASNAYQEDPSVVYSYNYEPHRIQKVLKPVSYNVSAYPYEHTPYYSDAPNNPSYPSSTPTYVSSPQPVPVYSTSSYDELYAAPREPTLVHYEPEVVPKTYRDSAYIEPERRHYVAKPLLLIKKYT